VDEYRRDFLLWAEALGADDWDAYVALSWLGDETLAVELHEALVACLSEFSPAYAAQVVADIGGEEMCHLLFVRAGRLVDARREARREELRTMPYHKYLRTPEWRERAEATYERFGGRCAFCNASGDLAAHHRTYERRGEEEPGDLTAFCPGCHSVLHEWRDLAPTT
jgi:hypothetical protein